MKDNQKGEIIFGKLETPEQSTTTKTLEERVEELEEELSRRREKEE